MGLKATAWAWGLWIPAEEKLVLLALADGANDEGHNCPSTDVVARFTGFTDDHIQRLIEELIRLNCVGAHPGGIHLHIHWEQVIPR